MCFVRLWLRLRRASSFDEQSIAGQDLIVRAAVALKHVAPVHTKYAIRTSWRWPGNENVIGREAAYPIQLADGIEGSKWGRVSFVATWRSIDLEAKQHTFAKSRQTAIPANRRTQRDVCYFCPVCIPVHPAYRCSMCRFSASSASSDTSNLRLLPSRWCLRASVVHKPESGDRNQASVTHVTSSPLSTFSYSSHSPSLPRTAQGIVPATIGSCTFWRAS